MAVLDLTTRRKMITPERLAALGQSCRAAGQRVVLCHGCFDIVHPGHVRYLEFARGQGDVLVVSITGDRAATSSNAGTNPAEVPLLSQDQRAENLAVISLVDHVVIAPGPTAQTVIQALSPQVYVKGKEFEQSDDPGFLSEKALVERLGGRVVFSSGGVEFSSAAIVGMLERVGGEPAVAIERLAADCRRWSVTAGGLRRIIEDGFAGKRIAVIGDAILDRYVFCDAANVAGEAPVLAVRPVHEETYLGGAAVLAAHLRHLGAQPHVFTGVGRDAASQQMLADLRRMGVEVTAVESRAVLPVKTRFLVETQKVLKVDQAPPQPLDTTLQRRVLGTLAEARTGLDAAIFCDFGLGVVSAGLLAQATPLLRPHVGLLAANISGPQRTLLACNDFDLLIPNEREFRAVLGDFEESLPTLAHRLMRQLMVPRLIVTMGPRGCILFQPQESSRDQWFHGRLRSDYLPSLATAIVDPLGAGDAFLCAATLALTAQATLPQAGYLGACAAAVTLARMGNPAVTSQDLAAHLLRRPELMPQSRAGNIAV